MEETAPPAGSSPEPNLAPPELLPVVPPEPLPALVPAARPVGPVEAAERIQTVDILRGFAILGIFVVNMGAFSAPFMLVFVEPDHWTAWYDRVAQILVAWLATGKFYTLFSFLFGLGLSIQMTRVESRGGRFVPLYVRRLLALLLIGLVHAFLIWMGDILVSYALLGFILLLFRRRSETTLKAWFIACFLLPLVLMTIGAAWGQFGSGESRPEEQMARMSETVDDSMRVYAAGTFREIMERRALDAADILGFLPIYGGQILALFLAGLWAGRRRLCEQIPEHVPLLRRARNWALPVGLALSGVFALTYESTNPLAPDFRGLGIQVCNAIGATSLSLAYACGIALLVQREEWRRRLGPIAAVGRTALSNYLLQSIVSTLIFYSYGLGLYGKVGPAAGLLLVAAVYAIQIPLSNWWLGRFRFGPAEWLWRSLTYARVQPMRAQPARP